MQRRDHTIFFPEELLGYPEPVAGSGGKPKLIFIDFLGFVAPLKTENKITFGHSDGNFRILPYASG